MYELIIAGVVAAASAITTAVATNKANDKAQKEQKDLALLARGDTIAQKNKENYLSEQSIGVQRDTLGLKNRELSYGIQKDKAATRAQHIANLGSTLDNLYQKDANMTNFVLSLYGKDKYNVNKTNSIGI